MTEITDAERQLLVVLLTSAWVKIRHDKFMLAEAADVETLLRKISGVDKRLTVEEVS